MTQSEASENMRKKIAMLHFTLLAEMFGVSDFWLEIRFPPPLDSHHYFRHWGRGGESFTLEKTR